VAQKFGQIEKFSLPKAQGSRMPLELCTMVLLSRVAARSNHGRKDGGRGAQFLGRRTTMKAPKSPNNVTSTSAQYICFRKTSGSNMGTPPNLVTPLEVIQYSSAFSMYIK